MLWKYRKNVTPCGEPDCPTCCPVNTTPTKTQRSNQ